ncbi:hypothetical protein L1887_59323 [Cichorium endivia]|nr:hypothetical protein L1887_59323 [Cichorium endivia]
MASTSLRVCRSGALALDLPESTDTVTPSSCARADRKTLTLEMTVDIARAKCLNVCKDATESIRRPKRGIVSKCDNAAYEGARAGERRASGYQTPTHRGPRRRSTAGPVLRNNVTLTKRGSRRQSDTVHPSSEAGTCAVYTACGGVPVLVSDGFVRVLARVTAVAARLGQVVEGTGDFRDRLRHRISCP